MVEKDLGATLHFDVDKDQRLSDISSTGDETHSVGLKDNKLPTTTISVKGLTLYNNG
jgi:hypothetical protein